MNKKIIKQFEEQFGKEWECSCKTPFGISSLEIISETTNSLLAHYVCPNCGKEQMLAASVSSEKSITEADLPTIQADPLNGDDVLDIQQEFKNFKLGGIRSLYKARVKKTPATSELLPPK